MRVLPKFRTVHHLIVLLTFAFIISFIYHEIIAPSRASKYCKWPQVKLSEGHKGFISDQDQDQHRSQDLATNVLLIADPQLIDNHTYPGRNSLLLDLSKHTVDQYLKKNYKNIVKNLNPDYIFFLGDYLDNGRSSSDEYFNKEWNRFEKIFLNSIDSKKYVKDENLFINLPGNHDIGWSNGVKLPSRERFQKIFGNPNTINTINNVEFISIDSLSYSSSNDAINSDSRNFVKQTFSPAIVKSKPRILLTHVPLNRDPAKQTCGKYRESSKFHLSGGYQYKLALEPDISLELLNSIKPDLIFSGDDHDYCDIVHTEAGVTESPAREITVKSISLAMGIKYPAVQLLTFQNSNDDTPFNYNTDICYLPTPYINIFHYILLSIISGLLLLWWNMKQRSSRYNYSILPTSIHATAILSNDKYSSSNATKISNFLKEQDDDTTKAKLITIPKYTSTTQNASSLPFSVYLSKCRTKLMNFMKKWNLFGFVKHCLFLGLLVICIYYFGFVLTV